MQKHARTDDPMAPRHVKSHVKYMSRMWLAETRPKQAKPSQAKAQDVNPREGCLKSACWTYLNNIVERAHEHRMSTGYVFSRAEDAHTIPQDIDSCAIAKVSFSSRPDTRLRVQWALLHVFLRVGEAQAHPDRRPKPKPSQARPSQEEGSGWQVKRFKTPHLTCFYVSEKPGPSPRPKTKPNASQARPGQTRPSRRI